MLEDELAVLTYIFPYRTMRWYYKHKYQQTLTNVSNLLFGEKHYWAQASL